ncbi:hypothetical protein SUGI_0194770 [Cryptomeria japonica]|nr:hypothetical protein SUGI_0194770 [Cryptomeria japonica]
MIILIIALFIVAIISTFLCRCDKQKPDQTSSPIQPNTRASTDQGDACENVECSDELSTLLTLKQIIEITGNFMVKLGEGNMGTSYYGKLKSGKEVAVKKVPIGLDHDLKALLNKVRSFPPCLHISLIESEYLVTKEIIDFTCKLDI